MNRTRLKPPSFPAATSRRRFLRFGIGAAAVGSAMFGASACDDDSSTAGLPDRLPSPADAPFDTVVVLMMENRSFDHLLGWLPGADGRQAGLWYPDTTGQPHATWRPQKDWQGCGYADPGHTWQEIAKQYADGRCDGFLMTAPLGDTFPISYYGEADLPILAALAQGYTTFDRYFCSMMGMTWENRLYQLTGTTQILDQEAPFPRCDAERMVDIPLAIFDRVRAAGLTTGYYHSGEPMTGLFKSKRYDDITYPYEKFLDDARHGRLPNVVFVEPNYTDQAEDEGSSNDYHHRGSVLVAEKFVAEVHDALAASPQWERMVFVLNFDEHGGFFDHVPPPRCEDDTVAEGPDLKRLGFRVPAIAMGPFAPRYIEKAGPYEHCSILKMIAWRWGLEPLTLRDRSARNLAEALDFNRRRDPVTLAPFVPPPPRVGGPCNDQTPSDPGMGSVCKNRVTTRVP